MKTSAKRLYLAFVLIFLALMGINFYFSHLKIVEGEVDTLTNLQETELNAFLEMTKLLTTLATAAIGAIAAFASYRYTVGGMPKSQEGKAIIASLLAGISILLGYVSYGKLVWMLHSHFFDLYTPFVYWPAQFQFYIFLLAIVVVCDFVFRGLRKE